MYIGTNISVSHLRGVFVFLEIKSLTVHVYLRIQWYTLECIFIDNICILSTNIFESAHEASESLLS